MLQLHLYTTGVATRCASDTVQTMKGCLVKQIGWLSVMSCTKEHKGKAAGFACLNRDV